MMINLYNKSVCIRKTLTLLYFLIGVTLPCFADVEKYSIVEVQISDGNSTLEGRGIVTEMDNDNVIVEILHPRGVREG